MIASLINSLASGKPTISVNLTFGFSYIISLYKYYANSYNSFTSLKSGKPFKTLTSKKSSFSFSFLFSFSYYFIIK